MKVIPKYLTGGNIFGSMFTTYTPILVESPTLVARLLKSDSTSKSSNSEKFTEKDFFNILKDIKGLPNEVNAIATNLMNTLLISSLTGVDPGDLATTYLKNLYSITVAALNKDTYDKAIELANKNGSMAEPAITMDGKLLVLDANGNISDIGLDNYFLNKDNYHLLSVSNLANLRAFHPGLAYKQEIFSVINNSVGFELFQSLIKQASETLGTTEYTRNGLFSVEGQAAKGLELLQNLSKDDRVQALGSVTADGLYEYKIIDKNLLNLIDALTNYMLAVLPNNVKTWAAFKLGTSNKDEATKNLIVAYLTAGASPSHTFNINLKGLDDTDSTGSTKSGTSKSNDVEMTFLTALLNGYGGRKETKTLNFGNNTNFNVTGTTYGASLGLDNKVVTNVTLEDLLAQTGIAGITNAKSITFGDNVINSNLLDKIAIENTGGFWAILPSIKKGNAVIPNFELINKFNELVQEVLNETNDNTSPDLKWALLEKKLQKNSELQELLNMSGKIDTSKVSAFYIVDGLASDRNFTFKNNPLIWSTNDQADIDYFKEVTKEKDFNDNFMWTGNLLGMSDTLYKSKVFIPIQTNNRLASVIFSGQKIKDSKALALEGEYLRYLTLNKMNVPLAEYLYK